MTENNNTVVMNDKYDDAIEYLTERYKWDEECIYDAWGDPGGYAGRGGELFGFVGPDWTDPSAIYDTRGVQVGSCGCLQQIRENGVEGGDGKSGSQEMSYWPRLWNEIARDRSIPSDYTEITVDDLPAFAEWQRAIDIHREADAQKAEQ